ncbi:MAG TPA: Wzz/FepE/Etk N-terminal domain-containing protein [candidate division Zixibacteria bacterium]|nr:Wzz/FepE/Etk N-terminal domain-containing protein [candidate division Zixibacteria bacterium]
MKEHLSDKNTSHDDLNHISLFDLVRILLSRRRMIASIVAIVVIPALAILLLLPNRYSSSATLLPTAPADKLAELKTLAGFGSANQAAESSSELFPTILRSRLVKDSVLNYSYVLDHGSAATTVTLAEYLDEDNPDKLRAALDGITSIATDKLTGVITVSVETEHPVLSRAVLSQYLRALEHFNLHQRASKAQENVRYLASQAARHKDSLTVAEENVRRFRAQNRNWAASANPDILAESVQLEREVEIQNTAYLYLARELEIARLDAQKDIPIVSVLDQPSLPTVKSGPYRLSILLAVLAVTLLSAVLIAFVLEAFRLKANRANDASLQNLRHQLEETFPRTSRLVLRRTENRVHETV